MLVDYIIRSCLSERPSMIPYIFDNQSLVKLSRHFYRHFSKSPKSCMLYSVGVKKYAEWVGYSPDALIDDIKPVGAIPDQLRVQNHLEFLNDYLAFCQDQGLKPSSVSNCIKAVKTFYRANGCKKIELDEPLTRKVAYKDTAPTPENIVSLLTIAPTRDAFIIAAMASGGFREGTFAKLKYRHVKEDFEANRVPIRVHVEAEITKGKYHEYDTFLNGEACELLKLYIRERQLGDRYTPPEILADEAPLIRGKHIGYKVVGISEKQIRKVVHDLYLKAGVTQKIQGSWMFTVRTHSLRKYFRTQMSTSKISDEIVKYFMGKTIDTYEHVQSLGIDKLRELYIAADLRFRTNTKISKLEQLKAMIRSFGENPEEILTKDTLLRNSTGNLDETQSHHLSILGEQLRAIIKKEVSA